MTSKLTIAHVAGKPQLTVVKLDDHDITGALSGLTIDLKPYEATVTLTPQVIALGTELDNAKVHIADEAHALLVRLGWTPPQQP